MSALLSLAHVDFAYEDVSPVLSNVSFTINEGESVALIGANGAGKSTLLLHTNGLLLPSKGQVCVKGVPLTKTTLAFARQQVGVVFQDPDDQLFMPTVEQDVAFGPRNMGLTPHEVEERVETALAQMDALMLKKRFSHKLSGGEKRKVAVATVLAMQPSLLVLDEPSAHLDPRSRRRLIAALQSLSQAKIIATHDLDLANHLCQRTIVLHRGKVVFDGSTSCAFASDTLLDQWEL